MSSLSFIYSVLLFKVIAFMHISAPALLEKTDDPCFKWKIQNFSALVRRGAISTNSNNFHCSGYNWFLQLTPLHRKKPYRATPYVALSLGLNLGIMGVRPGHTMEAVFVLSIYNYSKRLYCGYEGSYHFRVKNTYSKKECLIPLDKLLTSPDFVADDCCVFGVDILKINVFSPEKKVIPVQKNVTTVQNLFIQNGGFMRASCTFTLDNFLDYQLKYFISTSTFVFDDRKWYLGIYPLGDRYSTNCMSLYLHLDSSDVAPRESGRLVQLSLSIMDQKHGKHFTKKTPGLVVFAGECHWGWSDFLPLDIFFDPCTDYLVGSRCVFGAEITVIGSSSDG